MNMFTKLVVFAILVAPLSAAVVKNSINSCSPTEFACGDGGCVSAELVCDGTRNCADGGDEAACDVGGYTLSSEHLVLNRSRRQASGCRPDQWKCRDGSCISFDGKCDGIVDCRDGSDETHALCRKNVCQHNWFRCTYGACVDGTAPCNGDQECADNSDELLPRCRNETDEVRGRFKCLDGSTIPAASHCDGTRDCADGSDETVRACAGKTCSSYLFQCAYGACVDSGADCNQVQECADGSDEVAELCDKSGTAPVTPIKPQKGNCVLPSYPEFGTYVTNIPNGRPGEAYDFLAINVTCREGYGLDGSKSISCFNGWWPEKMPKCVPLCHLSPHPSVKYSCLVTDGGVDGTRICNEYEPSGTVVNPECNTPNYYSPAPLRYMHCYNNSWDHVATCNPGLTKNGTNITILIKDSVEIHVSDIHYVVPITNIHDRPVVPITDNNYNNLTSINDDNKFNGVVETVTSEPFDNSINIDSHNSNSHEATDAKSNESMYDIDPTDWRMGVPGKRSTKIPPNVYTKKQNESDTKNIHNKFGVIGNNYTNLYPVKTTSTTESNVEFDMDVRFGDSATKDNQSTEKNANTIPGNHSDSSNETNLYTTKNNNTNIYFNITNSTVHIHADGKVIFRN